MTLIDRLSKLDGPDREVDREIAKLFNMPWDYSAEWIKKRDEAGNRFDVPVAFPYTASVDAAIALAERVLPGWNGDLDIGKPIADSGKMGCRIWTPESKYQNYVGEGFNSATALLIALLRAKEAANGE